MIGRLDRYVFRIVAEAWAAALLFLLFISILMDLLHNMGVYLGSAEEAGMGIGSLLFRLGGYYLELVPSMFVTVAPFVTVIAGMFAVARILASSELHPMLFAGRSMSRVMRPLLLVATLSGLAMGLCWEWVMPSLSDSMDRNQSVLMGSSLEMKNLVLEPRDGTIRGFHVGRYLPDQRRMERVNLLIEGTGPGDSALVQADGAVWDERVGDWRLENGRIVSAQRRVDPREWLGAPAFPPDVVRQAGRENVEPGILPYSDLLELRRLRPQRDDVALALHRHITYPLANLVLLLLALPFTIHFERQNSIERVIGAILMCGAYLMVDLTCQSLGHRGDLEPEVAAWAPTILFGSLGAVLFGSVRT